jgi:hypothetical protein
MTAVTCPIMRYHPAIIAQGTATMGLLTGDCFTLGLGAGERLNEHVVSAGWPGVGERPAGTASSAGDQLQPSRRMEGAHQQVHRDHSAQR